MRANNSVITTKKDLIIERLSFTSNNAINYINNNPNSQFILYEKTLTHSDLLTKGKRKGKESLSKNNLYYLTIQEMEEMENNNDIKYPTTKQSNIWIPINFYEELGIPRLKNRIGKQTENHIHEKINDYVDTYIFNDSITYFNSNYTLEILSRLGKTYKTLGKNNFICSDNDYTPIQISQAIHGLGINQDVEFTKLRENMFLGDRIIFLIEKTEDLQKKLFVILEKNPKFFTLLGLSNQLYENYLHSLNEQFKAKAKMNLSELLETDNLTEKSRLFQGKWKSDLIAENSSYLPNAESVICSFSQQIFPRELAENLLIASHIKEYAACETVEEAFDINNGFLLSPNADKLFNYHFVSINEDGEFVYSFLIKDNIQLLMFFGCMNLFKPLLNEKRKEFLRYHYNKFLEKEEVRKRQF